MSFDKQYTERLVKDASHRAKTKDFGRKNLNSLLNQAAIQASSNLQQGFSYEAGFDSGENIGYKNGALEKTFYTTTIPGLSDQYHSGNKEVWDYLKVLVPKNFIKQHTLYRDLNKLTETKPNIIYRELNSDFKITIKRHRFF